MSTYHVDLGQKTKEIRLNMTWSQPHSKVAAQSISLPRISSSKVSTKFSIHRTLENKKRTQFEMKMGFHERIRRMF